MAVKKISFYFSPNLKGMNLAEVLGKELPTRLPSELSKSKIRKLIVAGAVSVNQRRLQIPSYLVPLNAKIDVYLDLDLLNALPVVSFEMQKSDVIFEDEDLIAVRKPPFLPTQPTLDQAREHLFGAVQKYTQGYVGLHHRLDRDTSGIVLFTKSKKANPGVGALFQDHKIQKTYEALIVCNLKLSERWGVKNFLKKEAHAGKKSKMVSVRSGGDLAQTDFRIRESLLPYYWVQALPLTGRTHQIRVHLSEGGSPILGDPFYGGPKEARALSVPRVMLHAGCLEFVHPLSGRKMKLECPPPADFQNLWTKLKAKS